MRKFSATVQQLLNEDSVSAFYLIKIEFVNTTAVYHTTFPYDLTISGLGTFISNNNLLGVDAPKLSDVVDREIYKIAYADNELEMINRLAYNAVGTPVTIYVGFINTSDQVLGGVNPGDPILNYSDILIAYRGIIDTYGYNVSTEEEVTCTIECGSPMAALDIVKPVYTSDDAIKRINPNDDCFKQVHIGSATVSVQWGKI